MQQVESCPVPHISIIILNWNGWEDTIECLESLYRIKYPNYDVILIDNGSTNDSIEKIKEYAYGKIQTESSFFRYDLENKPIDIMEYSVDSVLKGTNSQSIRGARHKRTILIKNDRNAGFTGGNNIGISYAMKSLDTDYVLLLNNDTVVDPAFLTELVRAGEINPAVGFLSPKIYFYEYGNNTDIIQYAGTKQNLWFFNPELTGIGEKDTGQYDSTSSVDFAHGSCMLIKKITLEKVGLLDPEYFSYREENDICMRGRINGIYSMYVPSAKIWHKGGKSTGKLSTLTTFYITRKEV
jgi:GT2 family glycosyltransferase